MFDGIIPALNELIRDLGSVDMTAGMLYCAVGLVASLLCCLEGVRIYKAVLLAYGFVNGFNLATDFIDLVPQDKIPEFFAEDWQFMFRVMCGLLLGVFAYKIMLLGIFSAVFRVMRVNLADYFTGTYASVLSLAAAGGLAWFSVKMTRPVLVIVTAVAGGFSAVYFFQRLLPIFPYDLGDMFPPVSSPFWMAVKVFISAAGVGVQDIREPR